MTSLNEARDFAAKTMTEDGLIDLFTGLGLILTGLFWNGDNAALAAIVPIALINLWKMFRRRFSEPRVGAVRLPKDKKKIASGRMVLALVVLTLVVGVIAWAQGGAGPVLGTNYYYLFAIGPSAMAGTMAILGGAYFKTARFYLYGAWIIAAGGITILYTEGPDLAFVLGGIPLLAAGLGLFSRFLIRHKRDAD